MFDRDTFIEPALETIADNPELYDQLEYKCATMLFLIITKLKDIHDKQIKSRKSAKGEEVKFQKRIKEIWKKIDEGDEDKIYRHELDQLRKDGKGQIEEAKTKGQKYRAVQKVINTGSNSKYIFRSYDKKKRGGGGGIGQIYHNGIKYDNEQEIMEIFTKIHADKTSEKTRQEHLENKMEGLIDLLTNLRQNITPENVSIITAEHIGSPP